MKPTDLISSKDLVLFSGPSELPAHREEFEPYSSLSRDFDTMGKVQYSVDEVAQCFDAIATPVGRRGAKPYEWKWFWDDGVHWVELGFSTEDLDPDDGDVGNVVRDGAWGGSKLDVCVPAERLLALWTQIRSRLPAVWLEEEFRVYLPETFLAEWAKAHPKK